MQMFLNHAKPYCDNCPYTCCVTVSRDQVLATLNHVQSVVCICNNLFGLLVDDSKLVSVGHCVLIKLLYHLLNL